MIDHHGPLGPVFFDVTTMSILADSAPGAASPQPDQRGLRGSAKPPATRL
jgi:hypothetical protein